jgi:hypothetical protein
MMIKNMKNLVLSNLYPLEFKVVINELEAFKSSLKDHVSIRRIKATIERAMRLAKSFTQVIIETFQANVLALGHAFNL